MKGLSCNSGSLLGLDLGEAIDLVAAHGYQAIDISLEVGPPFVPAPPPHLTPGDDAATRAQVRRHAEKAGITIAAVNAHTTLITGFDEVRRLNVEFLKGAIQLAADLGAGVVVFGSGRKDLYGYEQTYWERFIGATRELAPAADRLGVRLACEAASLPGVLLRNLQTMRRFLAHDGLESVGVLFDPAHYQVRGDDVIEAYRALADRVVHVHAKDARGNPEDFAFPPLGEGAIDFPRLFGAMLAVGYDGYVSLEYEAFAWGYPGEPARVLADGKAFLDRALAAAPAKRGQDP
jgi:sugar phosphate isomerase/epimerase